MKWQPLNRLSSSPKVIIQVKSLKVTQSASDFMLGRPRHKAIYLVGWGWTLSCLFLGYSGFNFWWFLIAQVFQWCSLTPQGSSGVIISCFYRLLISGLSIFDLFVSCVDSFGSHFADQIDRTSDEAEGEVGSSKTSLSTPPHTHTQQVIYKRPF